MDLSKKKKSELIEIIRKLLLDKEKAHEKIKQLEREVREYQNEVDSVIFHRGNRTYFG